MLRCRALALRSYYPLCTLHRFHVSYNHCRSERAIAMNEGEKTAGRSTQDESSRMHYGDMNSEREKYRLLESEIRDSGEKFRLVFEFAFDGISIFEEHPDSKQRKLVECNEQYARMAGRSREELLRIGNTESLAKPLSQDNSQSIEETVSFRGSFRWLRPDGKDNIIEYTAVPVVLQGKKYTIGIDRDVTEQRRLEAEREKLISELQQAVLDINMLSGLVPICASCKKIRDDHGYWTQIEQYIQEHSSAKFSHGICPDCTRKYFPDTPG